MKEHFLPAIKLTLLTILFFSGIYTLIIYAFAQFTPNHGNGFVIKQKDKIYFKNIGQNFSAENYFWSRPSAVNYNAAGSGGSNKGPSNPDYLKDVQTRIDSFLVHHSYLTKKDIPVEMVTASGSGLDPDISIQAAKIQVQRISKVRNMDENKINNLIETIKEKPFLGIFGPEKINVLQLNIELDNLN